MSKAHVYVVAAGYGKRVVPARIPFEFAISENDTLIASGAWRDAPPSRQVSPDAGVDRGEPADRVADIIEGPQRGEWWIETSVYSVPLPHAWIAVVSGEVSPAFDLVRGDCSIFVQTARNRPGLDRVAVHGQDEIARGSDDRADWVELSYVHDGRVWVQRHSLFRDQPQAMVTGQSPADEFPGVRTIQEAISRRAVFA